MGIIRGQTPPFRAPLAQPWDPGWDPITGFLDRPAPEGAPQVDRVECFGPVRFPKRKSDEMKLRELLNICRYGNIREARAIVQHTPQLLTFTDKYGLTALHHAQMSQKAEFFCNFLQLYHDPRFFERKFVRYENVQELREEFLCLEKPPGDRPPDPAPAPPAPGRGPAKPAPVLPLPPGPIVLQNLAKGSRACWEGVVPGDTLEGIYSDNPRSRNFRKIAREVCDTVDGAGKMEDCFPLSLEFRGPACRELLRECAKALSHVARGASAVSVPPGANIGKPIHVLKAQQSRGPRPAGQRGPRRLAPTEHGAGVLPTLLVREQQTRPMLPSITKRANEWWCHPMKPIIDARVASGRAAARVSVARAAAAQAANAKVEERRLPMIETSQSAPLLHALHRYGEAPQRSNVKVHHYRHYLPEEGLL
mmetsp:Transcript_61175/g.108856  ORF Transcript_61175/g.108856 Transcript_61175/m.108856 type:complete len:421 (-) Transcript_61175:48-1310(-)